MRVCFGRRLAGPGSGEVIVNLVAVTSRVIATAMVRVRRKAIIIFAIAVAATTTHVQ